MVCTSTPLYLYSCYNTTFVCPCRATEEIVRSFQALNLPHLARLCHNTVAAFEKCQFPTAPLPVRHMAELLHCVLSSIEVLFVDALAFHHGTTKFHFVFGRTAKYFFEKGFGEKKSDADDGEGEGEQEEGGEQGGVGMGEGQGSKDVSKEIKDMSQIEGLMGDELQQEQQQEVEEEDNGIEMEQDFAGAVSEMDKQEPKEDEEDEEKDEDMEEMDRKMGEGGENEEVVDEKLWDEEDSDEEEDRKQEEKYEKGASVKGGEEDVEMRGAEEEENEGKKEEEEKEGEEGEEQPKGKEGEPEGTEEDEGEEGSEEEKEGEDEDPNAMEYEDYHGFNAEKDEGMEEEEQGGEMELDEDMKLDEDGDEEKDDGEDSGSEGDDDFQDALENAGEAEAPETAEDKEKEGEGDEEEKEGKDTTVEDEAKEGEEEKEEEAEEEESAEEKEKEQPIESGGLEDTGKEEQDEGMESDSDEGKKEEEEQQKDPSQPSEQQETPEGTADEAGEDKVRADAKDLEGKEAPKEEAPKTERKEGGGGGAKEEEDVPEEDDAMDAMEQNVGPGAAGADSGQWQAASAEAAGGGDKERKKKQQPPQLHEEDTNPYANPDNALKAWEAMLREFATEDEEAEEGVEGGADEEKDAEGGGSSAAPKPSDVTKAPQGDMAMTAPVQEQEKDAEEEEKAEEEKKAQEEEEDATSSEQKQAEEEQAAGDGDIDMEEGKEEEEDALKEGEGEGEEGEEDMEDAPLNREKAEAKPSKMKPTGAEVRNPAVPWDGTIALPHTNSHQHLHCPVQPVEEADGEGDTDEDMEKRSQEEANDEDMEEDLARSNATDVIFNRNTYGSDVLDMEEGEGQEEMKASDLEAIGEDTGIGKLLTRAWPATFYHCMFNAAACGISVPFSEAAAKWAAVSAAVSSAASRLSESLRLILIPTLASKLKGDYRTGKRINMRKIIPYIASGFRKDKIWLRRTQPSKREYQVLLAIDNSRSMKDCGADKMASLSISLLASALSRLEVGQVGVARFGSQCNVLHPLTMPWSADAGPKVMQSLTFGEDSTDTLTALRSIVSYMTSARDTVTSAKGRECHQLVFLISDGALVQQNREKVSSFYSTPPLPRPSIRCMCPFGCGCAAGEVLDPRGLNPRHFNCAAAH